MGVLEKILEEIEIEEQKQRQVCKEIIKSPGYRIYEKTVGIVKEIIRYHMNVVENDGWIPVEERLPENDDYIMLSFEDFTVPAIGRYEEDEDGGGSFYLGDDDEGSTCASAGLFVNAWRPLPEPYKGE